MSTNRLNPILRQWIELNFFKKNPDYKTMTGQEFLLQLTLFEKKTLFLL